MDLITIINFNQSIFCLFLKDVDELRYKLLLQAEKTFFLLNAKCVM